MALRALLVSLALCALGLREEDLSFNQVHNGPLHKCFWKKNWYSLDVVSYSWNGGTAEVCIEELEREQSTPDYLHLWCEGQGYTDFTSISDAVTHLKDVYLKDFFGEWRPEEDAQELDQKELDMDGRIGPPLYKKGLNKDKLLKNPMDGSKTIVDLVRNAVERRGDNRAVGQRKLLEVVQVQLENGKQVEKLKLENKYEWLTYNEYWKRIEAFSRGLRATTQIKKQESLVLYAETARDWMTAAVAGFLANVRVVTIYATLGREGAEFGMRQANAKVVVADRKLLKEIYAIIQAGQVKTLEYVITLDPGNGEAVPDTNIKVMSFDDVCNSGKDQKTEPEELMPTDIAVVMFTSGTTGYPKGVLISHENLVAAIAGFEQLAKDSFRFDENTVYPAYLPLAHIMEVVAELSVILMGGSLGYGNPHTLTQSGPKRYEPEQKPGDKYETKPDVVLLEPNFIVLPPAILQMVFKVVKAGFHDWMKTVVEHPTVLSVLSKVVKKRLGGKVKLIVSGSAPLDSEVAKYISMVFEAPVRQGYGLTENCACAAAGQMDDNDLASVGSPTASTVIRLRDWEEGGYKNDDIKNPAIGKRRGEILVGGPTVSAGYLPDPHNAENNNDIMTKNNKEFLPINGVRFFATGDIGEVDIRGTLRIVDRKKDLWKGPNGEYVSLSKVEKCMNKAPPVDISMAYGKTGGLAVVALVVVIKGFQDAHCKEALTGCEPVVLQAIKDLCGGELKAFEMPMGIRVLPPMSWTSDNELLTAAMKLKRPQIVKAYEEQINTLCEETDTAVRKK